MILEQPTVVDAAGPNRVTVTVRHDDKTSDAKCREVAEAAAGLTKNVTYVRTENFLHSVTESNGSNGICTCTYLIELNSKWQVLMWLPNGKQLGDQVFAYSFSEVMANALARRPEAIAIQITHLCII